MVDVSSSFLEINYVMTSLLLLKVFCAFAKFLILSNNLLLIKKYFSLYGYFETNLDSTNKFNNIMTSDYVILSIKLSPEVVNDECIVLCNFCWQT